jgi:hypothetical protein
MHACVADGEPSPPRTTARARWKCSLIRCLPCWFEPYGAQQMSSMTAPGAFFLPFLAFFNSNLAAFDRLP